MTLLVTGKLFCRIDTFGQSGTFGIRDTFGHCDSFCHRDKVTKQQERGMRIREKRVRG